MSTHQHTTGPLEAIGNLVRTPLHQGGFLVGEFRDAGGNPHTGEAKANAHLFAGASDRALICWAMCVGAGRWEPWGDGRGEFCINGLRHATHLDEFGCPVLTGALRAAIVAAKGGVG